MRCLVALCLCLTLRYKQDKADKEQQVAALQGLKLITAKRKTALSPIQHRRNKLMGRIDEQIDLAQATLEQRTYVKQRHRSVKDEHGTRSTMLHKCVSSSGGLNKRVASCHCSYAMAAKSLLYHPRATLWSVLL